MRDGVRPFPGVSGGPRLPDLTWQDERRRCTDIAVLIPCRNEETTIAKVVTDFRRALPDAHVYVYDNASTDHTIEAARAAGAIVRAVPEIGKGNVVRRMFAEIDSDVYLLADGDDTYDAEAAPQLVQQLIDGHLDMVVGARVDSSAGIQPTRGGTAWETDCSPAPSTGCSGTVAASTYSPATGPFPDATQNRFPPFPGASRPRRK